MNYPAPLTKGDTIALIAPCSPVPKHSLSTALSAITDMGFHVVVGDSATSSLHGYLSGSDKVRANDINCMFANPDIKGIFCLRGGYGSNRIMDMIDYDCIRNHPKIFVGYSDITSFHLAFHALSGIITFHGPMVLANMAKDFDHYTKNSFYDAISMPHRYTFHNPKECPYEIIVPGTATGRIIGGCLSLVSPSLGTFYEPDLNGKILFLEDIDEYLPRCDKLMCHLKNNGVFDRVAGVVLGVFKDCNNPKDESYTINEFFQDFFCDYRKPVISNVWSCHKKPMGTIPFGTLCTMDTYENLLYFDYV